MAGNEATNCELLVPPTTIWVDDVRGGKPRLVFDRLIASPADTFGIVC